MTTIVVLGHVLLAGIVAPELFRCRYYRDLLVFGFLTILSLAAGIMVARCVRLPEIGTATMELFQPLVTFLGVNFR